MFYGRWRDELGRMIERPLGRGWLVAEGERGAKPNGKTIGAFRERAGRAPEGFLTIQAATQELGEVQRAWLEERLQEARQEQRANGVGLTVREAADRYLEWGGQDDPHTDRDGWKHSTAHNMRAYVNRLVRDLGEDQIFAEITSADLLALMSRLRPERGGKPTGVKPTRKFLNTYALPLKGMFALAFREGWVEEDAAAALPSYKPKRKRAADPMRRDDYLTPEEVAAVLAELPEQQDQAMVTVMAMGGLRPGEALALRWQDVDLSGANLRIVESRTMGVTGTPKSNSGRSLPMAPETAQAIATVGLREQLTRRTDLVFVGKQASHVDMAALRSRFNAAQDAAGVAPKRELRQLRNTFGTVCASAGVPLRTIQQWMGHENIATTERYASHMPRSRDAALISAAFSVGPAAVERVAQTD
jgi:integrase